jgi:ABC-type branched-subunit amino acid transport system permease subunit
VLSLDPSLLIVVASTLGGLGTIFGPLRGAYVIKLGQYYLSELPARVEALAFLEGQGWVTLLFLVLLMAVVLLAPQGLLGRWLDEH